MLPPGLLVEGAPEAIRAAFGALCALQPVRMTPVGLVCAPRCAPEEAAAALARCPLPTRALAEVPGWPDPPAAMVAGWYRRSPDHAPAPPGVRELVQAAGEGFGPGGHATTAMCLEALEVMPTGPALDAGCGSGLLAQAWAALGRGPVLAYDLDPRALDQAARSLEAAGLAGRVTLRRGALGALAPAEIAGRVLIANVPLEAHRSLLARIGAPPAAAVLSGIRPEAADALVDAYRAHGLRVRATDRDGRFACVAMVAA